MMESKDNFSVCVVYSEGKVIPDDYQLTYASVRMSVNRVGKATLKLYAGITEDQPFVASDDKCFRHGSKIKLEVEKEAKKSILFEGIVISTELQIDYGKPDMLIVECRDLSFLMTLGRKNAVYEESKDSDVIKKIVANYSGISAKIEDTSIKHQSLVQYYCSDWDFILSRADVNGLIITSKENKLNIAKPDVKSKPVAEVEYGVELFDFKGSLSMSAQYSAVNATAWDYATQKMIQVEASKQTANKQGDLSVADLSKANTNKRLYQTDAPADKESLKAWADASLLKAALSRYSGTFSINGNMDVISGSLVTLKGLGARFDGDIFVGSVEHIIKENKWTTTVGMGLDNYNVIEQPDVVAPLASGLIPGIQGLHIGIVKQLHEDPKKEHRLLVTLPLLNAESNDVWARLATPYSGNKTGMLFVPEIGEEVVIGFFNNDPCSPVVLGGMFSSKMNPPSPLTEKNEIKTLITKENLKIEFNDEKKIITITTPGKNMIEISDDQKSITINDQNKNSILMDSQGISLQSDKDITLKAKGGINIEATQKIGITSKADLAMEALNIKANAKVGLTLKGNAKAELSASGQTIVKGAMVMIN